ncbi:MAG: hypothetical protein LDL31_02010, partial [Prosthecobacter sp.]|nr:hypothetical protein [Prosthecobacter sp.]
MNYPYQLHQILEIIQMEKCLPQGEKLELKRTSRGGIGRDFETRPQLVDGPFVDMRYLGKAPEVDNPETYDASFLLANRRVRGIGYHSIGRRNFRYKRQIPKGWHLNVCD